MHVIAAKAVAFGEALRPEFKSYQKQVIENAKALSESLRAGGLRIVSGGTDNHLVLLDVGASGLTGKEVELALDQVHITVNKNTIPFEKRSPFVTSGIRLGTPAVTTRGLGISEIKHVAEWILEVTKILKSQSAENRVLPAQTVTSMKRTVEELCGKFPIYRI